MFAVNLLPGAVSEIIASAAETHCITKADRYGLMAAILDEAIAEEDRLSIDRLLRAILKGRVQIADELSAVM